MHSTRSASIIALRISPSPFCWLDSDPLARTVPTVPVGAQWWRKCWSQA